ncbi:MAG: tyrosine-protein phosphatase [Actinobacteria bacterium]|nr:MAG: tyrosine-protein phosphatase [Actinomycetota bacterium]
MGIPRTLGLNGAPNARDLGGLPVADGRTVRPGLVFRAQALGRLSDDDVAVLASLGLTDLLDLRHGSEIELAPPDRLPAGPQVAHIPIFDPAHPVFTYVSAVLLGHDLSRYAQLAVEGTPSAMLTVYRWFVSAPAARAAFATALRRITAATGPLLYHCSAGKDRTGWLSALLLGALGADRTTITDDYLLTNEVTAEAMAKLLAVMDTRKGVPPDVLRPVLDAAPEYLDAAFERLESEYGTLDRYLREGLGLGADELAALRRRLLD